MTDYGVKVSDSGDDVRYVLGSNLIIDSRLPFWKCDVAPVPKHYGYIDATISKTASEVKTFFSMEHNYPYVPSFLVVWSYPPGDGSGGADDSTYGVGDLEIFTPLVTFKSRITDKTFSISASSGDALSKLNVKFRFYIFAEDFPQYNYIPELSPVLS